MLKYVLEKIAEAKMNHALELNLSHCELSKLPETLFELVWLEYLNISDYTTKREKL